MNATTKKIYRIEHKIHTLARNTVERDETEKPLPFTVDDIEFSHWDFNYRDELVDDVWFAQGDIEAEGFEKSINKFWRKLSKIVPRIALISQCYIDYQSESFIVHKKDSNEAFFNYIGDRKQGGLHFVEYQKQALDELLCNQQIPDEFYYYWNDAVNTTGYSSKLLLMFSAIEALVRKRDKSKHRNTDDFKKHLLGEELVNTIFQKTHGIRNRLSHGEYFDPERDKGKNYFNQIHEKVITYFNDQVLSEPLIGKIRTHDGKGEVVEIRNPQRHPHNTKLSPWGCFIKRADESTNFELKDLLEGVDKQQTSFSISNKYRVIGDDDTLYKTY